MCKKNLNEFERGIYLFRIGLYLLGYFVPLGEAHVKVLEEQVAVENVALRIC